MKGLAFHAQGSFVLIRDCSPFTAIGLRDKTNHVDEWCMEKQVAGQDEHREPKQTCRISSREAIPYMYIYKLWYHGPYGHMICLGPISCVCVIVVVYSMALGPCNNLSPYRSLGNIYQVIYLLHCRTSCRGLTDWRNNEHANSFVGHIFIAQTSAQIAACLAAVDSRCRVQQWLAYEKPEKCTFALETERNHTRSQTRH